MIATLMPRCLHIYESGIQCIDYSLEPSDFCEAHQNVIAFEKLQDSSWRRTIFRFVAAVLLLLFLLPLLYTLRSLYFDPPVKAQEVW